MWDGVLSGRAQRQALVNKRRLDAIDHVWSSLETLAPYRSVAAEHGPNFDFAAVARRAPTEPKLQGVFKLISTTNVPDPPVLTNPAAGEPPISASSPLAWAYFSTYHTIVVSAYTFAQLLSIGVEDPDRLFATDYVRALVKAALPHHADYIDRTHPSAYFNLLDELQDRLLDELQKMIRGEEQDTTSLERAAAIMVQAAELSKRMALDHAKTTISGAQ